MATPMRSSDFRSIVEPILNESFDGVYDQRKDEWKQFMTEQTGTPRSYHEEVMLYGMGAAPELPDGMAVTYQSGGQLYVSRYTYKVYGLAFALTKVLVEDGDHIRIGNTFSRHLAQSMIETKETTAANILNRAFNNSYKGGDGVELVSNAHPAIGANQSNLLTSAANLSLTSLEQMLIQIRQATDSNGKKIRLNPQKLVVSPANVFQAEVILKSVLRSGTANNDINAIKSMGLLSGETAVVSRMTSNTAWFVMTDNTEGIKLLMRRRMEKSMEGDFETDSVRYKSTERYGMGWTDWRGIYGTPGV
jgi:hypothetical protein